MSILVTGFDRGCEDVNASQVLVSSLQDDLPPELTPWRSQLHFAILPLSSRDIGDALAVELEAYRPHYCVFTGQARGRNRVELERLATNLLDFESADTMGLQPRGERIEPSGPAACWSTLPHQERMVEVLNARGIPAVRSNYAGNHLCNQLLYLALRRKQQHDSSPDCGFVHIPPLPQQIRKQWPESPFMPLEMTRVALTEILSLLLQSAPEATS